MPKYVITSPDGKKYEVTAPDGASESEVMNFVMSQHANEPEQPKLDDPSLLVGIGKGMNDVARGVGDLFGKPNLTGIEPDKRADSAINDSTTGSIGQVIGNMAATAPTMLIPGAATLKGGALIGGMTGALTTEGNADKRLESGATGAIGGAAGNLVPYALNLAGKVLAPFGSAAQKEKIVGNLINHITEENAPDIIVRLESAQQLIPGSNQTAAEVANSGGISSLQRFAAAANPEQYATRDSSNKAARYAALQNIAGDESKMQSAKMARSNATTNDYATIHDTQLQSDADLERILNTDAGKSAVANARKLASNEYREFQDGDVLYGKDLHNIQRSLGAMAGDRNLDPVLRHSIGNVYGDYRSLLEQKIPGLLDVNKKYEELSQPINQMQVGQELLDKLGGALTKHGATGSEMGNRYATALNDVKGNLVKNATGGIKKNLEDVMSPDQMGMLKNIATELAGYKNFNDLGRGAGSNTMQQFMMNGISEAAGIPSAVSGLLQVLPGVRGTTGLLKSIASKAYDAPEREMKGILADALLDPKETARLMKQAQKKGLLDVGLEKGGKFGGLLGIGLSNTMQNQRD